MPKRILYRTVADTNEQVAASAGALLLGIAPQVTSTGTVTLRDAAATGGSEVRYVGGSGMVQGGVTFSGALFVNGITIQKSQAADVFILVYEPLAGA